MILFMNEIFSKEIFALMDVIVYYKIFGLHLITWSLFS